MDGTQGPLTLTPPGDPDIRGLTADSRDVRPGFLFAALAGSRVDGRGFVDDAVARGAVAVLTDDPTRVAALTQRSPPVRVIFDANPRRRLARMASRFYAPQPEVLVAVTGTNGKTSVTVFTRQIWQRLGRRAVSLGTIGIGLELSAAAFTNLTRDHLDYHKSMDAYFDAKARLFTELLPPDASAVLNIDVAEGRRLATLCRQRGQSVIGFGTAVDADLRLEAARPMDAGQELRLRVFGQTRDFILPLVGAFQASNALAALGLAIATGAPVEQALDALPTLAGVPGRLQHVATHPNGAPVIVDYAHTPDALETVLTALRAHCRGRLVVVFGCGGDRDAGKRPQMGAIAERLADRVIITDDNPRSEDPAAIRRAIRAAAPEAEEVGDRAAAIRRGLALLAPRDVLLLAGKGHERGQIVAGVTHPFDDAVVARTAVAELGGRHV